LQRCERPPRFLYRTAVASRSRCREKTLPLASWRAPERWSPRKTLQLAERPRAPMRSRVRQRGLRPETAPPLATEPRLEVWRLRER
jgi:hypothetical protein